MPQKIEGFLISNFYKKCLMKQINSLRVVQKFIKTVQQIKFGCAIILKNFFLKSIKNSNVIKIKKIIIDYIIGLFDLFYIGDLKIYV